MPPLFPKSYIPQAKTYNPTGDINPATGQPYVYGGAPVASAAPVAPAQSSFLSSNNNSGIVTPAEAPVTPPVARSKYINPATGGYFTPDEYANYVASKIPKGDVPKTAGDALTNPDASAADLTKTATSLNNARNDIAVGETDPYDITKGGTITYSPEERNAIEKAYAGVYDPALEDVFARLKTKQEEDKKLADAKLAIDKYWATTGANKSTTTVGKVATVNNYLNSLKGADGKISWETYVAAFQKYQELGGTLSDFKNRFIPEALMDANNVALVPEYFKGAATKWGSEADIWRELNTPEMKDQPDEVKAEYVQSQGFDPADFNL